MYVALLVTLFIFAAIGLAAIVGSLLWLLWPRKDEWPQSPYDVPL